MKARLLLVSTVIAAGVGLPAAAQPAPEPVTAHDFATTAAQSDQYEILAARVAVIEGRDPGVRAFAQQMIQDHAGTSQALRQAVVRSGMTPPPMALGGDQQKMLGALQSLTGPDFDRAYVTQQVLAHHQALVVEQGYAASGSDPNVRHAAQAAVPIIRRHLEMARRMQAMMGPS